MSLHHTCRHIIICPSSAVLGITLILAVGWGSVLAGKSREELSCGRRLVSGLFSRPRLPLGYSYVTTVPRGACHLNVSVIVPSENYIALKLVNSSYIINGEFAVSSLGSYDAAGSRFVYTRIGRQDLVSALGPLLEPVDIMILYTQPNPSIKYEYFTDYDEFETKTKIEGGEVHINKHSRRHHNFEQRSRVNPNLGNKPRYPNNDEDNIEEQPKENVVGSRRFLWKVFSYTQCTRTCGGGIQLGKFRCVESSHNAEDREVSPVHCAGSPPSSRRRRCGTTPCPPRWRTASWSPCPSCGPANRTRIVGCVQDNARGIIKVSDTNCLSSRPLTTENCNIPNCQNTSLDQTETKRPNRNRDQIDAFHDGPIYTVSVNGTGAGDDRGPEYSFSAVGRWLYTEWSECVGWCVGGGIETRAVKCADPAGCFPKRATNSSRPCTPKITCDKHEGQWFTGEWSTCSSPCNGRHIRGVLCIGGSGRHLRESSCKGPRPDHEKSCGIDCRPTWYISDWSQCSGNCVNGSGLQHRTVWCAHGDGPAAPDAECMQMKPKSHRSCTQTACKNAPDSIASNTGIVIESQTKTDNEIPYETKTQIECKDKLGKCQLAVQARLCHYDYYSKNCCHSCQGR